MYQSKKSLTNIDFAFKELPKKNVQFYLSRSAVIMILINVAQTRVAL